MVDSLLHSEVRSLRELNELAQRERWDLCADDGGQFYFSELQQVCSIWRERAVDGIPRRADLPARAFKPYLSLISIHEGVPEPGGGRRYRMRLAGQTLADDLGDSTGKFYEQFLPADRVRAWNAMSDIVLELGIPLRFLLRSDELGMCGELFAAPMRSNDDRTDLILSARQFSPAWDWGELLSHWREDQGVASTER